MRERLDEFRPGHFEGIRGCRRATARHHLLEIVVEEFVRIVLGGIEPAPAEAGGGR